MKKPFKYQSPGCSLTLREGLEEYYNGQIGLLRPQNLPTQSAELFYRHDLCHIIFGLDTHLADEMLADAWTMFATDVGVKVYVAYLTQSSEAAQLFAQLGPLKMLGVLFKSIPRLLTVLYRAMRVKHRLPWSQLDRYLDVPLNEIRDQFSIRIF